MIHLSGDGTAQHVIFLSDYDMLLAGKLVAGMDVWLNTPQRPGKPAHSGMKVLVNGGLNLSELDGWWVEAYTPEVGWRWVMAGAWHRSRPGRPRGGRPLQLLEKEVIPAFYNRNAEGFPSPG